MPNMSDKATRHQELCYELNEIYRVKNKKYGDSFSKTFQEYGPSVLCIRLDDKLNRLKQLLLHGEADTEDERVEDTLKDLANYAVMSLVELELLKTGGVKRDE